MRPTTKILLACLLVLPLVLPARADPGQEQSFADENCALTPPADWHRLEGINQPGLFAAFSNADRSRTVLLMVHQRGHPAAELSDTWTAAFDRGVTKAGGDERLSGKIVQIAGYSAYERRGTSSLKDHPKSSLMIAMPTGEGIYLLEGLASTGDAGEDAEIRQTLATFHFLHSPGPTRSMAYYWLGYFLVLVVFAVVVCSVIWLVVRVATRSRSTVPAAPSGPYPYPAGAPFPPPLAAPPPLPPSGPLTPPPPPPPTP